MAAPRAGLRGGMRRKQTGREGKTQLKCWEDSGSQLGCGAPRPALGSSPSTRRRRRVPGPGATRGVLPPPPAAPTRTPTAPTRTPTAAPPPRGLPPPPRLPHADSHRPRRLTRTPTALPPNAAPRLRVVTALGTEAQARPTESPRGLRPGAAGRGAPALPKHCGEASADVPGRPPRPPQRRPSTPTPHLVTAASLQPIRMRGSKHGFCGPPLT